MSDNDQAEKDCDRGGEKDQAARLAGRNLRRQVGANHARGDEAGAEHERQHDRGENRVDYAQDPGGDIEKAADHPEKEPAPAARMHADADFGRAGDQEQDAVERHRGDRRDERKEQRREAQDHQEDAKSGDRRPFSP